MFKINNTKFYNASIKKFGVSPQGVHWNSKYSQYKRFEIITSRIQNELKQSSLIDAGCGFGEYYHYLTLHKQTPQEYIGIDCEINMIKIAQERFAHLEFYVKNVLKDTLIQSDYYICSGALNLLSKEEFFLFIQNALKHSNKGFIFNFLKDESFNHIKPQEVITFCKSLNPKDIEIFEGYLNNDMTLFLKQ